MKELFFTGYKERDREKGGAGKWGEKETVYHMVHLKLDEYADF